VGKNKIIIIVAVVVVAACAYVVCSGGGIFVASNPSLVQIDQLDSYKVTSTPYVVMELPSTVPTVLVPTSTLAPPSTPAPISAPVPGNTPQPTATLIVLNLEAVQAMTEVGLNDFTPFFAEITRQTWDDEITDTQADEKSEKLRSIFSGKHLRDTKVTVTDANFFDFSDGGECTLNTEADYSYSMGHMWVDSIYEKNSMILEVEDTTADYCRSFNIGQALTVSGELEFAYGTVKLVNPTIGP
jgi:hypothetical protein